ncbi:site-2 protease family protein [Blastopirellula sp. JC732]|uniref:Site-2 protease family protein n=1 Tax=Blastopirellula sediminis TaxID=2894196 RepID=A0A9X1SFP5_9BACT|nr:site-2 protease family protein [Blastopirellula sediminis]MCC9607282.1 site-2 protease family protein [Blastopirellula sediminis]MCC9629425.1 site-2 protease family protein [Blastopirellula sediminis]
MDYVLLAETNFLGILTNLGFFAMGVAGLGLVIFIHELGHFLAAKACGVKCEKFYVGFDAPISIGPWKFSALWKKQWGETEYGIGTIPLGGYVKMLGQDDNPAAAEEEIARSKEGGEGGQHDPRSYLAKSVPQRMMIISAGVTFNVISAVIFAAIAYMIGVSYTPCDVAYAQPGGPAWIAGIRPGDKILSVTPGAEPNENLRFRKDLTLAVVMNGDEKAMPIVIRRDDKLLDFDVQPKKPFPKADFPLLGISPENTLKVAKPSEEYAMLVGDPEWMKQLQTDDLLVEVDGKPIANYVEWENILATRPADTLKLKFERTEGSGDAAKKSTYDIELPPTPYRQTGLVMEMTPIEHVQAGSPAETQGLKAGDKLVKIGDVTAADGYTLASRSAKYAGQTVDVVITRDGEEKTFLIPMRRPLQYNTQSGYGSELAVDMLGVSYSLTNRVADVLAGSPAEAAGLKAGDEIRTLKLKPTDSQKESGYSWPKSDEPLKLIEDEVDWQDAFNAAFQYLPAEVPVEVIFHREGTNETQTALITPVDSKDQFIEHRYIVFVSPSPKYVAKSLGEAFALGFQETGSGMGQVFAMLRKLVTGKVPLAGFGGPGTILAVATSESSQGLGRLLLFLTLISANLAVINFMPIPVLDGGHMVFLLYEGIMGKPLDEKWMMRLTFAGLAFVLLLMICVIGLDINRFLPWITG